MLINKLNLYHFSCIIIFSLSFWYLFEPISLSVWLLLFVFAIVTTLFNIKPIVLHSGEHLTLVTPLLFAAGVLYGVATLFVISLLMIVFLILLVPKKWVNHIFNGVQYTLSGVIAFIVYFFIEAQVELPFNHLIAFVGYAIVFYMVNVFFVATYLKIRDGKKYSEMLEVYLERNAVIIYFTNLAIGLLMVVVVDEDGIVGFLIFCLILSGVSLTYRSFYYMFDHFKSLSEKDELTRLYNHRYFQESLEKSIQEHQKVALLIIDLDYFKIYNDTFGHPKGDVLLREIASLIQNNIPEDAIASRYGGEEFTVIVPNEEKQGAITIAEKIRLAVCNHLFEGSEKMPNNCITVSIGISIYPGMAMSREGLIENADKALYKSKTLRNTVSY